MIWYHFASVSLLNRFNDHSRISYGIFSEKGKNRKNEPTPHSQQPESKSVTNNIEPIFEDKYIMSWAFVCVHDHFNYYYQVHNQIHNAFSTEITAMDCFHFKKPKKKTVLLIIPANSQQMKWIINSLWKINIFFTVECWSQHIKVYFFVSHFINDYASNYNNFAPLSHLMETGVIFRLLFFTLGSLKWFNWTKKHTHTKKVSAIHFALILKCQTKLSISCMRYCNTIIFPIKAMIKQNKKNVFIDISTEDSFKWNSIGMALSLSVSIAYFFWSPFLSYDIWIFLYDATNKSKVLMCILRHNIRII